MLAVQYGRFTTTLKPFQILSIFTLRDGLSTRASREGRLTRLKVLRLQKPLFFPFSIGIRGCPGKNLARLELSVTFARLIFSYDIQGEQGDCLGEGNTTMMWGRRHKSQFQTKVALIPLRDTPKVRFRKRQY
jgi:hypothetical protein